MKDFIGKLYYWFWHDFLCRTEPFTHTARRQVKKWWPLWVALGGGSASFLTWFLLHLGGIC